MSKLSKKIPSAKSTPVTKLAEKPVIAESQDVNALLVHPPNLPLRPYLDDIWDVLTGFDGDIGDIDSDLALKSNIASPTFTGTVVLPSSTSVGTVSSAEIAFIDGLTSNAQTQIDGKNATLISGVNLKTVNGNSLLGAGDVVIAAGIGDMILAATQTVTGDKTFEDGTLLLRNVGNTFNGQFVNTNLADRTYTLKDANGTLAFTSDITGTNSGTNTGDQTSIVGITGSLAEFNTALTGADFATGGGTATGTNTGDQTLASLGAIGGSIANTQVAYGTAANTIGGSSNLYYDGTNFHLVGNGSSANGFIVINATNNLSLFMGGSSGAFANLAGFYNTGSDGFTILNSALARTLDVAQNGALKVGSYGAGSITGTPTYVLAVDSGGNIIETTLVSNATHTGDATGSAALTVVGINSTLLSGLATGILKNTTSTGVPSIAVAGDFPVLNQNTTGTANIAGGTLGAVPYQSGAGATTVLAATATANKILLSGSSAAPVWSTPTFPNASATTGKVIKSDGTNWVASTETIAAPGTSGNVLTSDGTNWTSAAPSSSSTYTVPIQMGYPGADLSFVDSATTYAGVRVISSTVDVLAANDNNWYVYKTCTITAARVMLYVTTTAGSNENWSMYIRVNDTTDTLIATTAASANMRTWANTGLSIALSSGDWFVVKIVNPAWATNPTGTTGGLHVHIEVEY